MKLPYFPTVFKNKYFLVIFIFFTASLASSAIIIATTSKPVAKIATPSTKTSSEESSVAAKPLPYYITLSQEFLTKAENLSKKDEQTPEEKQKIIDTVNQALDQANQAIANYPEDARGFYQRAVIYQALGTFMPDSYKFAVRDLREAININSQNPQYHTRAAAIYLKIGDFNSAAVAYYNAYTISPTDSQVLYDLADTLEKSGQLAKAKIYFEKLISIMPPDDPSIEAVKSRQKNIVSLLAQANTAGLTDPGANLTTSDLAPQASDQSADIIGTQELPLEQAAVGTRLVIANPESETASVHQDTSLSVNAKSGIGVIPAGQTVVTIQNNNIGTSSQIILSPASDIDNEVLRLEAKKAGDKGWFKAAIDKPLSFDLNFNWWITE